MTAAPKELKSQGISDEAADDLVRRLAPTPLLPPANGEVEMALIGAILAQNSIYHEATAAGLKPHHFAYTVHQTIYKTLAKLIDDGQRADTVSLKRFFDLDQTLDTVGGQRYLAQLVTSVVTLTNNADYARQLIDLWKAREGLRILDETTAALRRVGADHKAADTVLMEAESAMSDLVSADAVETASRTMKDLTRDALAAYEYALSNPGAVYGITTGLKDLDDVLGGLQKKRLHYVGGRPGMGKTSFLTTVIFNSCEQENYQAALDGRKSRPFLFFSQEMSAEQITDRLIASICAYSRKLSAQDLRLGRFDPQEHWDAVYDAARRVAKLNVIVVDRGSLSSEYMRAVARRAARKNGGLLGIGIDHMQLIEQSTHSENRRLEIAKASKTFKEMAKELDCPVVCLSQLRREVDSRPNKRPINADLLEAGAIEADADVILFPYREEFYLERDEPKSRLPGETDIEFASRHSQWKARMYEAMNKAEVILGKNRDGMIRDVNVHYDKKGTCFRDLDTVHREG